MKPLIALFVFATSTSVWGRDGGERTVDLALDGATVIVLDVGVGEVKIRPSQDGDIHARVTLKKSGSWLWPFGAASKQMARAKLKVERDEGTLRMAIETTRRNHRFKERWNLYLPENLDLRLDMGVGAVDIRGLQAALNVDLGVGEVDIRARREWIGDIDGEVGVGDVSVHGAENIRSERHVVGATASAKGDGTMKISVDVGVGDCTVRLE